MTPLARYLLGNPSDRATVAQRATHTYVIGQPGTGKSRAIESWVMQDIESGEGVTVVDPHGDLFRHLVCRLAYKPDLWQRVILLNPCDRKWTVNFNPLAAIQGVSPERLALFLTDVVIKIWRLDPASSPRMVWLLTNSFLALAGLGLSLLDLPRFLEDAVWRNSLLLRLPNERARAYFTYEFPQGAAAVQQWVTPVLNKIGNLLFDPDIRLMLGGRSGLNFRDILDKKLILLVNLPKGRIGEGASALFGAFIVAHIQKAALARADAVYRAPYFLYLDEFQNYTTDNIIDILSESRKYALSLTLAHQYLAQLNPDLRSAVLNTAGTITSFRVSHHDATQLVKEIFPSPDFIKTRKREFKMRRMWPWPLITVEERDEALKWEGLSQCLVNLRPREFWVKRRGQYAPTKLRTLDMPDPSFTPELRTRIQELRDISGARFGRLKSVVQREYAHSWSGFPTTTVGSSGSPPQSDDEWGMGDIPLWDN